MFLCCNGVAPTPPNITALILLRKHFMKGLKLAELEVVARSFTLSSILFRLEYVSFRKGIAILQLLFRGDFVYCLPIERNECPE